MSARFCPKVVLALNHCELQSHAEVPCLRALLLPELVATPSTLIDMIIVLEV